MTQEPNNPQTDDHQPDDVEPSEYAPEEPTSTETGTVYEDVTGEPAVTPADEAATEDEEELP